MLEILSVLLFALRYNDCTPTPKKIVVSGNPTDPSFYPPNPKSFMDFILGPKFFGFNFHRIHHEFQLLPHHASCLDRLSTKIIKHVKVK